MTEINSHSGNLSNYIQTKHENNKQKIIPYQAICQTEGTHFQSFGQMTGNFRHLTK